MIRLPHHNQLIVSLIAFWVLYFCKLSTVSTQMLTFQAFPLVAVPWSMFAPAASVSFDSRNECDDRRPDCSVFRAVCDHPDYKQYMWGCCRGTCDPKCAQKGESSSHLNKAKDEARQRRNEEAIRRKYLGDSEYFRPESRDWQQNETTMARQPFGVGDGRRQIPEGAKWRDDDRWDRNDPWTLRRRGNGRQ